MSGTLQGSDVAISGTVVITSNPIGSTYETTDGTITE